MVWKKGTSQIRLRSSPACLEWRLKLNRKGGFTPIVFPREFLQHSQQVSRLDRARWRALRRETTVAQREQLTRFRFRHKREAFLTSLEERWAVAASTLL